MVQAVIYTYVCLSSGHGIPPIFPLEALALETPLWSLGGGGRAEAATFTLHGWAVP